MEKRVIKTTSIIILLILSISIVIGADNLQIQAHSNASDNAVTANTSENRNLKPDNKNISTQNQDNNSNIRRQIPVKIRTRKRVIRQGNYTISNERLLNVRQTSKNKIQLRIRNISSDVSSDLNLTQEQEQNKTRLRARLSNGKHAEIKIMPDKASETALKRLRLRACNKSNNCSIELKEVALESQGNQLNKTAAYEIRAQKQARILGLFKTKMNVQAQIDAESGEVISEKKPWWAFLASE